MRKYLMIIVIVMCTILFPAEVKAVEMDIEEEVLIQQIALAEANSQGIGGMAFVMQVIENRVVSPSFPDTVYEVITQEGQFATYSSGIYKNFSPNKNSQQALELLTILENQGQLYFENPGGKTSTWHSRNLEFVFEYQDHVFYK